ncbi:MAG: hypothetical protein ACI87A_001287, partial [Planctomycetota bacterium]
RRADLCVGRGQSLDIFSAMIALDFGGCQNANTSVFCELKAHRKTFQTPFLGAPANICAAEPPEIHVRIV